MGRLAWLRDFLGGLIPNLRNAHCNEQIARGFLARHVAVFFGWNATAKAPYSVADVVTKNRQDTDPNRVGASHHLSEATR